MRIILNVDFLLLLNLTLFLPCKVLRNGEESLTFGEHCDKVKEVSTTIPYSI